MWSKINFSKRQIHSGMLFLLLVVGYCIVDWRSTGRDLFGDRAVIWVFDVGQGDSIFINAPGKQVLIDGGPDDLVLEKLSAALPFWDRSIDLVVNTHPHADHVTGLVSVLERYSVSEVLISPAGYQTPEYLQFLKNYSQQRVPRISEVINLGGGAELKVIYLPVVIPSTYFADPNDASIVLEFTDGDTTMLLTGDAGVEEEQKFANGLGHIDILKVGHHGSDTATSRYLLEQITPSIGIISAGKDNDYGHPDPLILDRLLRAGIKVFRTDLDHDVQIKTDGHTSKIKLFDL